jgi:hypothetical protein
MDSYPDTPFQSFLARRRACDEGRAWVGSKTPEQAWEECENGEWMDWLLVVTYSWGEASFLLQVQRMEFMEKAQESWKKYYVGAIAFLRWGYFEEIRRARSEWAHLLRLAVPAQAVAKKIAALQDAH